MRFKINPLTGAIGAFAGLVVIAGGLLAAQPARHARILPDESSAVATDSVALSAPVPAAVAEIPQSFAGAAVGPEPGFVSDAPIAAPAPSVPVGPPVAAVAALAGAAITTPVAAVAPVKPAATPNAPAPAAKLAAAPRDERFVIKRILPIDGPIRYGEWHWDEAGVPAGPLVITVDLQARVLSVFRGGYEIGTTAVLLGTQEKPTPLGIFPIKLKDKNHFSATYDHAPMPYTLRLTNDGVSIHGTKVEKGYASHGCVGVPNDFGAKLFAIAHLGDKVYITRGKMIGKGDSLIG